MASYKEKLTDVSFAGFNVENIEALPGHLRTLTTALYGGDTTRCELEASAIESHAAQLVTRVRSHVQRIRARIATAEQHQRTRRGREAMRQAKEAIR